jgi:diadenosine tetraphosphate (Ap4A) HIT family hydrolase
MSQENHAFELHPQLARDCLWVADLVLNRVLLMNDRSYPWFILVPRRDSLRELYQLDDADQALFWRESALLGRLLMSHFRGDKLNIAALGNMVPQLHVHHIVRYSSDAAWPRPVWGVAAARPYEAEEADALINGVRALLAASAPDCAQ